MTYTTTPGRRRNMQAIRRKDTKPEVRLRSALHRLGYRFRKDYRIDLPECRVRPDIVFTRAKLAVFVDGCFWHACPEHGTQPKQNVDYWNPKLRTNVLRDQRNNHALETAGWTVVRIWEHCAIDDATGAVREALSNEAGERDPSPGRL
ncbi:very short patch repair endonuclease [Pseudonocardia nematodicida]|uniref:Very short patch repair endonuclease n=1 Tax=Pseudonocardia nematodicida TaxID=1206997 RepID=A0ABV1KBA8_9PSEU